MLLKLVKVVQNQEVLFKISLINYFEYYKKLISSLYMKPYFYTILSFFTKISCLTKSVKVGVCFSCSCLFNISFSGWIPASVLKNRLRTCVFQWILGNFQEYLSCNTYANGCFWNYLDQFNHVASSDFCAQISMVNDLFSKDVENTWRWNV